MRSADRPALPGMLLVLCALCGSAGEPAAARPETIRAGVVYYSDSEVSDGFVRDLGPERNYEEVYQHHRYFEAVYDDANRVVIFRSYLRGELERTERYRYTGQGGLAERSVERVGEPPEVTRWPAAGTP